MRKEKQCKKGFVRTLMATVCIIGASTLTFQVATQVVLGMETDRAVVSATSYTAVPTAMGKEQGGELPEGYVKANYQLVDNDLEAFKDRKPTSADLSREKAAELGVQGLYRVFGIDMNDKVIEMSYYPAQDGHRATWSGIWWPDGLKSSSEAYVQSYSFEVDAVTGELYSVMHDRVLDGSSNTGFDTGLNQNSGEYEALAKEMAVKLGAIKGSVKSVDQKGQGLTNNDPNIFFSLTGEQGDRAQIKFSRHDRELLAVIFDAGMKDMDISIQEADDFDKRSEEYFKQNPGATTYEEF